MANRFYTVERIGPKQSLTQEGFLLCEDVPIARTGALVYGPKETPLEVGKDGLVQVVRDEATLFDTQVLSSFEGKPVTNDHPPSEVTPENFREYVVGVVQNVRRGKGDQSDLLLADLLIHDKDAIEAVRDGKREVSCGYDADYEQTAPGRGRQISIVGNHVALVENGRCGSRCAIQDRSMTMTKKTWKDRIRDAFKTKDEKEMEEAMAAAAPDDGTATHVHVHLNGSEKPVEEAVQKDEEDPKVAAELAEGGSTEDRLARIEALIESLIEALAGGGDKQKYATDEEEAKKEEKKDDKKDEASKDSAFKMQVRDVAARAEILVPGAKLPTFDSVSSLTEFKRRTLVQALDGTHKDTVSALLTGVDLSKAAAATVDALFGGCSELVKQKNNSAGVRSTVTTQDFGRRVTPTEINKRNAEFWTRRA